MKAQRQPGPDSKLGRELNEVIKLSSCEVTYLRHRYCRITFRGPASKVPSVSNNRMTVIPKARIRKIIDDIMQREKYSLELVQRLSEEFDALQPQSFINPKHEMILTAMSRLWLDAKPITLETFKSGVDARLLVLVLCGEELRRSDSHNIVKAACDWLQRAGVIANDLHADAMAFRSQDIFPGFDGTSFIVAPQSYSKGLGSDSIGELVRHVVREATLIGSDLSSFVAPSHRMPKQLGF